MMFSTLFGFASLIAFCNAAGNTYLPPKYVETTSFGSTGYAEDEGSYVVEGRHSYNQHNSGGFHNDRHAQIVRYENDNNGLGDFKYSYETQNNIRHEESGDLKHIGSESAVVVKGSYSYTSPDGQVITINYVADENGYRAEGNHLPTPPPIPDAILKSLEYNRQHGQDWTSSQTNGH